MLLPKGGSRELYTRRALPMFRWALTMLSRPRFMIALALTGLLVLTIKGLRTSASEVQRYYCFGPNKSPARMTPNELEEWQTQFQTEVLVNPHQPYRINSSSIEVVDLNKVHSTKSAVFKKERVLILTPLRNAARFLGHYFDLVTQLTYPHELIDLGFLVGDSNDETMVILSSELERIQTHAGTAPFRSAKIVQKDFGETLDMQKVEDKHGFAAQGPRRKGLGKARNFLLSATLQPDHSWVYWRDVDIQESPPGIIQDFTSHDKDVLVPNIWFHRYDSNGHDIEGRFDYNSWQESETGLKLADSLPKDTVLAEGYKEFRTDRKYLVGMGDWRNNRDDEVPLDGIGGVNIVVKADVHRAGINFPSYAFENQAETEGFGKMAKRAGYQVVGLPNYIVWHVDTEEKSDNLGGRKAY